jgi:hypothetical protein
VETEVDQRLVGAIKLRAPLVPVYLDLTWPDLRESLSKSEHNVNSNISLSDKIFLSRGSSHAFLTCLFRHVSHARTYCRSECVDICELMCLRRKRCSEGKSPNG